MVLFYILSVKCYLEILNVNGVILSLYYMDIVCFFKNNLIVNSFFSTSLPNKGVLPVQSAVSLHFMAKNIWYHKKALEAWHCVSTWLHCNS